MQTRCALTNLLLSVVLLAISALPVYSQSENDPSGSQSNALFLPLISSTHSTQTDPATNVLVELNEGASDSEDQQTLIESDLSGATDETVFAAVNTSRKVYAQYHLWYTRDSEVLPGYGSNGPNNGLWHRWSQLTHKAVVIGGVAPTNFITPWRRVTLSKLGLPLVGVYSSGATSGSISSQVMQYHFQLAKQAGIEGMFASVFDGAWYGIFDRHLGLAQGVGFFLGLDLYRGLYNDCNTSLAAANQGLEDLLVNLLNRSTGGYQYKNHPAFLKIDNRPVIWIANGRLRADGTPCPAGTNGHGRTFAWGNSSQMQGILNNVVSRAGNFYIVMTIGNHHEPELRNFAGIPQVHKIISASNTGVFWNTFGYGNYANQQLNSSHRTTFQNNYDNTISTAKSNTTPTGGASKLALHVYPAFDERGFFPTNDDRGSGLLAARTVIVRNGNGMYSAADGFLEAALQRAIAHGNLWVFIESWNDWAEQTQLEPGFHFSKFSEHRDYFSALRRIAEFKEMTGTSNANNLAFSLPSASILDAQGVKKYCRSKEWSGLTGFVKPTGVVRLKGRFGFAQSASSTHGVNFVILYQDSNGVWQAKKVINKTYTGQLVNFDEDITSILGRPLVFGIDANGTYGFDQIYMTEFKLNWYGLREINLINHTILTGFSWHNPTTNIQFGTSTQNGTAVIATGVTLEDNSTPATPMLYLHPNFVDNGFIHAGINFDATGAPKRVRLIGAFGFSQAAAGTNGVAFSVQYLDDDDNIDVTGDSVGDAVWKGLPLINKSYTQKLGRFDVDITPFLDKPAMVFGIEANGSYANDQVYLTEFKLNWYGQEINLINSSILGQLNWHSTTHSGLWGSSGPNGTAVIASNVTLEDGSRPTTPMLYLHPNYVNNGFIHAGLDFWKISPYITTC